MTQFIGMFVAVLAIVSVVLAILAIINGLRKNSPGCSGSHDCVVYKGEKVQCPSCELKEYQAMQAAQKTCSNHTA